MRRHILTGTPGAGKTTLLHRPELGYPVVEEAATDVIAREQAQGCGEPWTRAEFIDQILDLQRAREDAAPPGPVILHDRSPICTHALSTFQGREPSVLLRSELDRVIRDDVYHPTVFFVANLGFCRPTAARRISYEDSLVFEQIHRDAYRALGYQLIEIPAAPVDERAEAVIAALARI
ncbi:AAA family ATPase [Actinospica durhamensis]|uniref:AAA family ATPase n=1 Tax=Actinospica durhamensis TaxID=1508375 RepID=A0A941ESS6_9ACTN|nr:AAA family ATPase [Actinospica durhamensis]MBR7836376.1 AAA family ATPase [Actinospica durhamensis]